MERTVVSVANSVELVPISDLLRFGRAGSRVYLKFLKSPSRRIEVPGSVSVSCSSSDGAYKKKITFERSGLSPEVSSGLEIMKASRFICLYTDECGNRRVCGSPSWPLSLDYSDAGGVNEVSVEGSDVRPDGFLAV